MADGDGDGDGDGGGKAGKDGAGTGTGTGTGGVVVATGVAHIHRSEAGDHGYIIEANLTAFRTGAHTLYVECKYEGGDGKWFGLKKSPVCLKDGDAIAC
jgi:hypothetical protein